MRFLLVSFTIFSPSRNFLLEQKSSCYSNSALVITLLYLFSCLQDNLLLDTSENTNSTLKNLGYTRIVVPTEEFLKFAESNLRVIFKKNVCGHLEFKPQVIRPTCITKKLWGTQQRIINKFLWKCFVNTESSLTKC